jgi:hypothetical protein
LQRKRYFDYEKKCFMSSHLAAIRERKTRRDNFFNKGDSVQISWEERVE